MYICQITFKSVERFKRRARMYKTDDRRRTDGSLCGDMCKNTQKCRIACDARAIPPKKRQTILAQ